MENSYSQSDPVDLDRITTAEDLLSLLREGNNQKLEIGLGKLKVPCRLLNAKEEAIITAQAESRALKENPQGAKREIFEAQEVMKAILLAATNIKGVPGFPQKLVDMLSNQELTTLFDQYVSLNHTINPNIQDLSQVEIQAMVDNVKKKKTAASDYYSWQLAAVGKFFLDKIIPNLPMDSGAGSA